MFPGAGSKAYRRKMGILLPLQCGSAQRICEKNPLLDMICVDLTMESGLEAVRES